MSATARSPPSHVKAHTAAAASPPLRPTQLLRVLLFLGTLISYCVLVGWYSTRLHYYLPTPLESLHHPETGLPQISEAQALDYIHHYADTIGYRIVGTPEMDQTVQYTLSIANKLKADIDPSSSIRMDIDHQIGDGHHLFDFMGKRVWKKYLGISNVVVRLHSGQESMEDAILINAHLDSTLPSPGAADDAAGVAVMLEVIRVISQTPGLVLKHSLIFLFNGAEESLQDASHLFITKHLWRDTVRAVVNLEACGTGGAEMLFQATSTEMIKAYSHVPRAMGTVMATEVFMTGLIGSDTDFRQFVQYGNLTGLDIALIKDSYKYHTRLDTSDQLEPGALQNFGQNVLAILLYLSSKPSSAELRAIKPARDTVFFSAFGGNIFLMVKKQVATCFYALLWLCAVGYTARQARCDRRSGYAICAIGIPVTSIFGIVTANVTAFTMVQCLDQRLTYFTKEWYALVLYGVPTLLGIAVGQLGLSHFLESRKYFKTGEGLLEHASLVGMLLYTSTFTLGLHVAGIMSAYIIAVPALSIFMALIVNDFVLIRGRESAARRGISGLTHFLCQAIPLLIGGEGFALVLDIIVPLTGRMGATAPSDHIISVTVSAMIPLVLPVFPSLLHRWGTGMLYRLVLLLTIMTAVVVAIFAAPQWPSFDAMHPKRVCVLYMENTTSNSLDLHIAGLDNTITLFAQMVEDATDIMELSNRPQISHINDDIPDWDIIYPVSQFLHSYKIPLDSLPAAYRSPFKDSFTVQVVESRLNAVQQTRELQIVIKHPQIIWTVIAFDADVIRWDLPEQPPRGITRHHIKEASSFNISEWQLSMTIQLGQDQFDAALRQSQRKKGQRPKHDEQWQTDAVLGGLRIDFSGLDVNRMWHSQGARDRVGMEFLERLDKALPDYVDPMLLTAVAGVAVV